jgi:glycosyltransferase involved in cell wall biosynthesis
MIGAPFTSTSARPPIGVLGRHVPECSGQLMDPEVSKPRDGAVDNLLAVIIPVFNEGAVFQELLASLVASIPQAMATQTSSFAGCELVVVDDGSDVAVMIGDGIVVRTPSWARGAVHLLRHSTNMGQGAALQTGIAYARDTLGCNIFVLLDADGQHSPEDMPRLLSPICDGQADIVFGSRFLDGQTTNLPSLRRFLLRGAIWLERMLTHLKFTDSHNGFIAFGPRTARVLDLAQNRMAYATEMKQVVARHGLRFVEVGVSISYSEATLRKGQKNLGALAILNDLLRSYFFQG